MTLSLQSLSTRVSPCMPHTHIYMSHISLLWKNLQAYNIQDSVQWKKEPKNITHSHLLGIVSQHNEFHTIPSQILTTHNSQSMLS